MHFFLLNPWHVAHMTSVFFRTKPDVKWNNNEKYEITQRILSLQARSFFGRPSAQLLAHHGMIPTASLSKMNELLKLNALFISCNKKILLGKNICLKGKKNYVFSIFMKF